MRSIRSANPVRWWRRWAGAWSSITLLDPVPVAGEWGEGKAGIWAEQLSANAPDTRTLLRYGAGNGWLDGQAAVIGRPVGSGTIAYIGALLDRDLMRSAARQMIGAARVQRLSALRPKVSRSADVSAPRARFSS